MRHEDPEDKSNGYERIAESFIAERSRSIGVATVLEWSEPLPRGTAILDLGCGFGEPISKALSGAGFIIYGVDASARMVEAFRDRLPGANVQHAAVEESDFFGRRFDAVIAIGLMFLLAPHVQESLIGKVARVVNPGGRFLFTAPQETATWNDLKTGRASVSLGLTGYSRILKEAGLSLDGHARDAGDNYYFLASKLNGSARNHSGPSH